MVARSSARVSSGHGARNTVNGVISGGATWYENVSIELNGITDPDLLTWTMTFQSEEGGNVELTLTSSSGLTVTDNGDDTATMLINVAASSLTSMDGDYVCNLKSTNSAGDGRVIHWAQGIVTFRNSPPSS